MQTTFKNGLQARCINARANGLHAPCINRVRVSIHRRDFPKFDSVLFYPGPFRVARPVALATRLQASRSRGLCPVTFLFVDMTSVTRI